MRSVLPTLGCLAVLLTAGTGVWAQTDNTDPAAAGAMGEDHMLTPPPVSGQAYPVALDSQERGNSMQLGVTFSSVYSDNVLGAATGHPLSDIGYSLWPTIDMDEARSRLHWSLDYAPGFTFYERTSARNEGDHNAKLGFQYRLSPHVTFSAQDTFQKTSNVFNQPGPTSAVFAGTQGPNDSIITPLADRLSNFATMAMTYQYGRDDMVGAGGAFSNLHYPDPAQSPGVWDSSSQAGSAFYTHRISRQHYLGAAYQYARLMSYPGGLDAETQTHSLFLFYTVYPSRQLSMSFFTGPQHCETEQPAIRSLGYTALSLRSWAPTGGGSLDWEGHFISGALSYLHAISESGGLIGAVKMDNASASVRFQLSPTVAGSISGSYANNNVLGYSSGTNGHTTSGTFGIARQLGQRVNVALGYTRLHQTYSVQAIAGAPDTNREFISLSYVFARPLGR